MKPLSLVVPFCILLVGCKPAEQFDTAAVKAKIEAISKASEQANLKRDAITAASYYDENAVMLVPTTPMVKGKANIEKTMIGWMQSPMKLKAVNFATISVEGSGDMAVQLGKYFETFDMEGKVIADTGKFVTVWKKQMDGSWKIAYDVWNSDSPAPATAPNPEQTKKQ
jgi:ketosteroid isomerase-like protein